MVLDENELKYSYVFQYEISVYIVIRKKEMKVFKNYSRWMSRECICGFLHFCIFLNVWPKNCSTQAMVNFSPLQWKRLKTFLNEAIGSLIAKTSIYVSDFFNHIQQTSTEIHLISKCLLLFSILPKNEQKQFTWGTVVVGQFSSFDFWRTEDTKKTILN